MNAVYCFVLRQRQSGMEVLTRTSFTDRRYDVPNDLSGVGDTPELAALRIIEQQTGFRVELGQIKLNPSQQGDPFCSVMVTGDTKDRFSYTIPDTQRDIAEFHYRWLPVDATLPDMLVEPAAHYASALITQYAGQSSAIREEPGAGWRQRLSDMLVHIWGKWPIPEWLRNLVVHIIEPKFLAGVVGIVFDEQDRVLLVRHTYRRDFPWAPPSGWIKRGEDPTQALEREIFEETGYRVWVGGAIAVGGDKRKPRLDLYYRCALLGGVFRPCAEVSEAMFCSVDALPEAMEPFHREVIDYAQKRPGAAIPPRAG